MEEYLAKGCWDIDVIFAHNDNIAIGAVDTLKEHGIKPGVDVNDGTTDALTALQKGEIQCVVEQRLWYMGAVQRLGWTKLELVQKITENAHEEIALAIDEDMCYTETQENGEIHCKRSNVQRITEVIKYLLRKSGFQWQKKEGGRRRWPITLCPIFMEKRIAFMRC